MADTTNHWRSITSESGKWRPSCTCGWKGRLSRSTDQAACQFSGHMARISAPPLLAREAATEQPNTEKSHSALPSSQPASDVKDEGLSLTRLDALARLYASSYASPHHITFTVEGLRNLIDALSSPQQEQEKP